MITIAAAAIWAAITVYPTLPHPSSGHAVQVGPTMEMVDRWGPYETEHECKQRQAQLAAQFLSRVVRPHLGPKGSFKIVELHCGDRLEGQDSEPRPGTADERSI